MRLTALGIAALVAFTSMPAAAGFVTGNIIHVYARQHDGLVFFELDTPITNRAACASTNNLWVIADENSETGKRQYAALLAAKASNQQVGVQGSGACTRWINSEDVDTLIF